MNIFERWQTDRDMRQYHGYVDELQTTINRRHIGDCCVLGLCLLIIALHAVQWAAP